MATVSSHMMPPPSEGNLLAQFVPDEVLYEVVNNRIMELPPMGIRENLLTATLMRILSPFAWNHELGQVVAEALFLLVTLPENCSGVPTWPSSPSTAGRARGRLRVPRLGTWSPIWRSKS